MLQLSANLSVPFSRFTSIRADIFNADEEAISSILAKEKQCSSPLHNQANSHQTTSPANLVRQKSLLASTTRHYVPRILVSARRRPGDERSHAG